MMDNRKMVTHSMQGVFVFVLLGLFAVMSTLMVLLGAQMYRNTVDHATENNEGRVLGAYVRSMIRAEDSAGDVAIEDHDGVNTLALYEQIDDERYVTWLYCYNGQMYEQFTGADRQFKPLSGTVICPAKTFAPALNDNLLTVNVVDGANRMDTVRVALRCAQ